MVASSRGGMAICVSHFQGTPRGGVPLSFPQKKGTSLPSNGFEKTAIVIDGKDCNSTHNFNYFLIGVPLLTLLLGPSG